MIPESRPYRPYGACAEIFRRRDPELVLSSAAGTGKTVACLSRVFLCAEKYPGSRHLICRKTRESMTQSVLVTWEERVVPVGHPCLAGPNRSQRREYSFPNGSKVIVDGLRQSSRDNSQRVMSTEYDTILCVEAIELSEEEFEKLTTRLRNNKMPYQQILAETNPSAPTHWLKKRCERGRSVMLYSEHTDNPLLYDHDKKEFTEFGKTYLSKLDALTGARKARLRYGKWQSAEGAVYEEWNPALHIIDAFDIPKSWRRFMSIDFGFVNPFVCQWYAIDSDGRAYLYREYVRTRELVENHAKVIKSYCERDGIWPEAIICDHDAEDRATLTKHLGRGTIAARKEITVGIQSLQSRLKVQQDGKARFYVFREALVDRDPELEEQKKPIGFAEEVDGYVFQTSDPTKLKETPIAINDHSCFVDGTMIETMRGQTPIENVTTEDVVMTRKGWKRVLSLTGPKLADVFAIALSNGRTLTGTGNHPIWVENAPGGSQFLRLDSLRYGDMIYPQHSEGKSCKSRLALLFIRAEKSLSRRSSLATASTAATQSRSVGRIACTSSVASDIFIGKSGHITTARSLKRCKFITSMKTPGIMRLAIWKFLPSRITAADIGRKKDLPPTSRGLRKFARSLLRGIAAKKDLSGIENKARESCETGRCSKNNASTAANASSPKDRGLGFAVSYARQQTVAQAALMMLTALATAAASCLELINIRSRNPARAFVVLISPLRQKQVVRNLAVEGCHEYFANGVLVHNCDPARYLSQHLETDIWVGPKNDNDPREQLKENPIGWRDAEKAEWRSGSTNWRLLEEV